MAKHNEAVQLGYLWHNIKGIIQFLQPAISTFQHSDKWQGFVSYALDPICLVSQ